MLKLTRLATTVATIASLAAFAAGGARPGRVVWGGLRLTSSLALLIADFDGLGIIAQLKHASHADLSAETVGGRCE